MTRGVEWRTAAVFGIDAEAREALETVEKLASHGPVAVPGIFMPDQAIRRHLRSLGVIEEAEEDDFRRVKAVALPFGGVPARSKRRWQDEGWKVVDTRSPHVRRAQVTLGLLRLEGAQTLVIGRHDDPESLALASDYAGTLILEDTTDIARMKYAPAFGAVCQTTLSSRRVEWLSQQLKLRYRDARMSVLNTVSPGMVVRERALESMCGWADGVVVLGDPGESSVEALLETAARLGKPAITVMDEQDPDFSGLEESRKIVITAGVFVCRERVELLARKVHAGA